MNNKSFVLLILSGWLFCFSSFASSGDVIKDKSFGGASDGSRITLRWITENEANVSSFEIERRSGATGEFSYIGSVSPKHTPSQYDFVDYSAFKANGETLYQYRIKVTFSQDRNPVYSDIISVSHFVSGVRKTWGSIKAMFR